MKLVDAQIKVLNLQSDEDSQWKSFELPQVDGIREWYAIGCILGNQLVVFGKVDQLSTDSNVVETYTIGFPLQGETNNWQHMSTIDSGEYIPRIVENTSNLILE